MKYRRIKVNLPKALIAEIGKVATNKSASVTRALRDCFAKEEKRRKELLEAYRDAAKHPEYEKDACDDW